MRTKVEDENRFENDASRYATYLDTPEGRLRADLTFANLEEFLPSPNGMKSLHALDVGCGTGATSVRLARLGFEVSLFDASSAMLDLAKRNAVEAGVEEKIAIKRGEASHLADVFEPAPFDIVLCHNVLEYVDDPVAALRSFLGLMRNSSAILSLLVRNQAGEVLKAALNNGDLAAAEQNLSTEWGRESLYGGDVRFFTPESLEAMLKEASFTIVARRGVRVVSDYLPAKVSRESEYERIFALERKLAKRQEFFGMARYIHYFASPTSRGK